MTFGRGSGGIGSAMTAPPARCHSKKRWNLWRKGSGRGLPRGRGFCFDSATLALRRASPRAEPEGAPSILFSAQ